MKRLTAPAVAAAIAVLPTSAMADPLAFSRGFGAIRDYQPCNAGTCVTVVQ